MTPKEKHRPTVDRTVFSQRSARCAIQLSRPGGDQTDHKRKSQSNGLGQGRARKKGSGLAHDRRENA
jgi:hypothetical protein